VPICANDSWAHTFTSINSGAFYKTKPQLNHYQKWKKSKTFLLLTGKSLYQEPWLKLLFEATCPSQFDRTHLRLTIISTFTSGKVPGAEEVTWTFVDLVVLFLSASHRGQIILSTSMTRGKLQKSFNNTVSDVLMYDKTLLILIFSSATGPCCRYPLTLQFCSPSFCAEHNCLLEQTRVLLSSSICILDEPLVWEYIVNTVPFSTNKNQVPVQS